ncbi:MAG TPA: cupin domain-containing protein, partial [Candidatus Agrococcus pullicola]|nr:cupin domain-containing protein [Candidatus Agrococcus pullicola]
LTSADETGGTYDVTDSVQTPGARTPLHLHTRYEERLYILEGEATVWLGDETLTLGVGDFVKIPMHVPHAVQSGPEGSRALNITSPAGFAELIARAGTPAAEAGESTQMNVDLFAQVSAELGDVVLGPPGMTPADLPPSDRPSS